MVIGGQWQNNGGSYGMAVAAVPSKRIPEAMKRLTDKYVKERQKDENFQKFIARIGKVEIKNVLQDLTVLPTHDAEPELFSDWGDPREYTIADIGKGECAGEIVAPSEFSTTAAENKVFEAQLKLDAKDFKGAVDYAYDSMVFAAEAVIRNHNREYVGSADTTVEIFRKSFFETGVFVKHVNNTQFSAFLFKAHDNKLTNPSQDEAHRRVEEAQLYLEAVYSYMNNAEPGPVPAAK
jgi:sulfite reductase (ferredoxin)